MANQTIGDLTPVGVVTDATLFEVEASSASGSVTGLDITTFVGGAFLSVGTYDPSGIAEQLVGLTATQALANKTLTSPTINGGTITGITDLAVADGGTGSSTAAGARTNLGLVIGTDVQAWDATLDSLSGLAFVNGDIVYATAADTLQRLGVGTNGQVLTLAAGIPSWADTAGDLLAANNLSDVASAVTSRSNLGLEIGVDVQAFDANNAVLDVENQTLTGGASVTSKDLGTQTTGTLTLDLGDRPLQHYTNGGAHTLAPGAVNGGALIDIVNDGSAGAITTTGWTNVVGSFTTVNTDAFRCHASVGNDGSLLIIQAMQ